MKKWKVKNSKISLLKTSNLSVYKDIAIDFAEQEQECFYLENKGGVIIIPIEVDTGGENITYTMVSQYRHPPGEFLLEFPKGFLNKGESSSDGAKRELKKKTGLVAKNLEFVYSFLPDANLSESQVSVYLAHIDGQDAISSDNKGCAQEVIKVSANDLLKKVQHNDIRDGHTLAALSAVMLQTNEAKRFLSNLGE